MRSYERLILHGSIRVTTCSDACTLYDSTNSGHSLAGLVGDFVGGDFVSGAVRSTETGVLHVFDGRGSFRLEEATSQWFLVEVYLPAGADTWSQEYRLYLQSLGFRLSHTAGGSGGASAAGEPVAGRSAPGGSGSASAARDPEAGAQRYKALISVPHDRVLVEGCCDNGSLLQQRTKFSRGCKVVPITRDDDFASEPGMRKCIENLSGPADTLWYSAPCTGGSTWQFIKIRRGPATMAKIKLHWQLFKRLWSAFEVVA